MNQEQLKQVTTGQGFIAALDQSGGSTPKALKLYGVEESAYKGDAEMFDMVHAMRSRIVTSPAFDGKRVIGAILFEATMDRQIDGVDAATYLWEKKHVVPFLKVDKGLNDEADGVQTMKAMPELDALLKRAVAKGIFGTKMRSVVNSANEKGIAAVLDQQFAVGQQILAAGLMPILEPEVSIGAADKKEAEALLKDGFLQRLDALPEGSKVMLKLTLPTVEGFFDELVAHKNVVRVVALSGGYPRDQANVHLSKNKGVIASFSRALTEGLSAQQSDAEFDAALDKAVESIYQASKT
ncbi:MAG: fructose bisphosphate aldolase [Variovorax sp.]|nr:MAG: fructose bisphosphate aldolase [Variovorax sp.]